MGKPNLDEEMVKLADKVNKKRRLELISIYNNTEMFRHIKRLKDTGVYAGGNKSKTMRAVASYPVEVDEFFQKIYGEEYYKDENFFRNRHPEWRIVEKI